MNFLSKIKLQLDDDSRSIVPGGAFAILHEGTIVDELCCGSETLSSKRRINKKTKFHAASLAKQFTAYLIHAAQQEKLLHLETRLGDVVAEFGEAISSVTIEQLLNHTSGIIDQWTLTSFLGKGPGDAVDTKYVVDLLKRFDRLNFEPGTNFVYCNSGYTLLSLILEEVYGEPFQKLATAKIFKPLGMRDTFFPDTAHDISRNRAIAYTKIDGRYVECDAKYAVNGSTSLQTSLEDMIRWVGATYTVDCSFFREVLDYRSTLSSKLGYKNGFFILDSDEYKVIGHGGNDYGFYSALYYDPENATSVIGLSNGSLASLEGEVLDELSIKSLVKSQIRKVKKFRPLSNEIVEGFYANEDYSDVRRFSYEDGHLKMLWGAEIALQFDQASKEYRNKTSSIAIKAGNLTGNRTPRIISSNWAGNTELTYIAGIEGENRTDIKGLFLSKELGITAELRTAGHKTSEFWLGSKCYGPIKWVTQDLFVFSSYWAYVRRGMNGVAEKLELSHPRARRIEFVKVQMGEGDTAVHVS
ncbi:MAG: hypothetical protein DHS20C05_02630 [Hyphococcus sp.]|nr:MAG: hypothetical protein DHS20C05_02630 [Marinicaulis sp.]